MYRPLDHPLLRRLREQVLYSAGPIGSTLLSYNLGPEAYVAADGASLGPFTLEQLQDDLASGRHTPATLVWRDGFADWLPAGQVPELQPGAQPLSQAAPGQGPVTLLSGPEGGLSPTEEQAALDAGFAPANLGPRVLRSETAPLAVLAALTLV